MRYSSGLFTPITLCGQRRGIWNTDRLNRRDMVCTKADLEVLMAADPELFIDSILDDFQT